MKESFHSVRNELQEQNIAKNEKESKDYEEEYNDDYQEDKNDDYQEEKNDEKQEDYRYENNEEEDEVIRIDMFLFHKFGNCLFGA